MNLIHNGIIIYYNNSDNNSNVSILILDIDN